MPVGLYKIIANIHNREIITYEYISSEENKNIVILAKSKNRTIKDLTQLIKYYPNAVNLYTEKAIKLARKKKFQEALLFINKSISKFPYSAELYSEKAKLLSTHNIFLKRGRNNNKKSLIAAWRSIELNPSIKMLDGLSTALAANEQFSLASKIQKIIIKNQERYYTIYGRNNKKFMKNIGKKIEAYQKKVIWIPIDEVVTQGLTKKEKQFNGTTGFSDFITEAQNLKGKYPTEKYCRMYAQIAITQYKVNKEQDCKLEIKYRHDVSILWHNNKEKHFKYCVNSNNVYRCSKFVQDREKALYSCIK